MTRRDVVIIGAPRSGTKMLRDVLTRRPGVVTWPCDEINAVWRHGSRDHPSDEIPADRASAGLQRFVQSRFDQVRRQQRGHTVVEKTCANSLRVDYVAALLPRARFVLITRDGVDAVASALARWHAPVDWRYTARKARFVPFSDLAHSAVQFAINRAAPRTSRKENRHTWGPRFEGMDEMLRSRTLEEVCAVQWLRCIELSRAALDRIPEDQVHRIEYESFVRRPEEGLSALLTSLGLPADDLGPAVAGVNPTSIGKGRSTLDGTQLDCVHGILSPTLRQLGYA